MLQQRPANHGFILIAQQSRRRNRLCGRQSPCPSSILCTHILTTPKFHASRHRMCRLIRIRHQPMIHRIRNRRIPMSCRLRKSRHSQEHQRNPRCQRPRRQPHALLLRRQHRRQIHPQRILRRTNRYALQAPRALHRLDFHQLVHRQCRRASLRALSAINARLRIPPDLHRAQPGSESQQRPVRAQEPAPEIRYKHRCRHNQAQNHQSGLSDMPEKVQHLDIGNQAIRAGHKIAYAHRGHRRNRPHKKSQQKILQSAQRQINPARQVEIPPKQFFPRPPQIFRKSSNRTKPTAKCLPKHKRHRNKRQQQKHRCRMHQRDLPAQQPVLQVHQPGNRQPTLHSRGTRHLRWSQTQFKMPYPRIKLRPDPQIQQQKRSLKTPPVNRRPVLLNAPNQLLFGFGRDGLSGTRWNEWVFNCRGCRARCLGRHCFRL